jgi:ferrous iron transport protein B
LLIMELPPYRRPLARVVLRHMWDRSKVFLQRAGSVILGINILLWFLATYPRSDALDAPFEAKRQELTEQLGAALKAVIPERADVVTAPQISEPTSLPDSLAAVKAAMEDLNREEAGERLRRSFAGWMGRAIEPVIAPLGFDWKIGIGIVASFAAREVFVSTMSTVYNVGDGGDSDATRGNLVRTLQSQTRPDGTPLYTALLGITLMVFYVFALQCASTVAIVRRETNSWKWPLFQWAYMGVLAWLFAFVVYQGGRWLGWG